MTTVGPNNPRWSKHHLVPMAPDGPNESKPQLVLTTPVSPDDLSQFSVVDLTHLVCLMYCLLLWCCIAAGGGWTAELQQRDRRTT